jgi:hypothetical protein
MRPRPGSSPPEAPQAPPRRPPQIIDLVNRLRQLRAGKIQDGLRKLVAAGGSATVVKLNNLAAAERNMVRGEAGGGCGRGRLQPGPPAARQGAGQRMRRDGACCSARAAQPPQQPAARGVPQGASGGSAPCAGSTSPPNTRLCCRAQVRTFLAGGMDMFHELAQVGGAASPPVAQAAHAPARRCPGRCTLRAWRCSRLKGAEQRSLQAGARS